MLLLKIVSELEHNKQTFILMKIKPVFFLNILFAGVCFVITSTAVSAQTAKNKTTATVKLTATELEEGKILISKSDCLACHKLDVKLIGPSYRDVAKKYPATEANYNLLIEKIIKGGAGVWGKMSMSPHTTLKVADAMKIVKYILSIK